MSGPALFGVYVVALLAANLPVVGALIDLSRQDNTASHVVLVPFVTLVLVFWDRRAVFSSVQRAPRAGAGVALLGLAVLAVGRRALAAGVTDALSLSVAGLVVALAGGFLFAFGARAVRAAAFPLAFLCFTVPFPEAVIAGATQVLKNGSTEVVAWLFTLTGTPYYREDYIFVLSTVAIEIADACSGIRSSIGLLLTGLLAGYACLRRPWSRAVLLAAVLPMTILKNGIRIVALTLLAMHVDPSYLTGQLHHEGGIVFFLLALGLLAPVLVALQRLEVREPPIRSAPANAAAHD